MYNRPSHKFSTRSKKVIFVCYSGNSKVFRVYFFGGSRVIISRSEYFEEYSDNHSKVGPSKLQAESFHPEIKLDDSGKEMKTLFSMRLKWKMKIENYQVA